MISTIRNLLYIFCRNSAAAAEVTKTNMREDMATAFNTSINNISGTTSMTVLKEFANNILLGVSKEYQPTLELFACTLNSLLKTELQKNIPMPTPKQYTDNLLGVDGSLIDAIFKEITGHNDDITVTKRTDPPRLSTDWPELCLEINDKIVKKKVTVAFGKRGRGTHIEIIDIKTAN